MHQAGAPYFKKLTLIGLKYKRDPGTTTGGDFNAHPYLHPGHVTEKSQLKQSSQIEFIFTYRIFHPQM